MDQIFSNIMVFVTHIEKKNGFAEIG